MLNPDLGNFTYSSQPHAAPTKTVTKQQRYRDPNETPLTLMSDPRVVRGSTHTLARKIALSKTEMSKSQTVVARRGHVEHEPPSQPAYRFEVKPFSNDEIDVSRYLVQQTDYRPQKKALDTQTDEFLHRPDTPEYVPAKVGVDIGTQVEDVRDLFDFDSEVTPMVEVITQKTIDQALFELSSEEELKNLEIAARDFRTEKFRSEEWMRNRENQAIKENKQRRERIQALQTARENEKRTKTIIAGVQMMRQTFAHSVATAMDQLVKAGVWREIDHAVAEKEFVPEVVEQSSKLIDGHAAAVDALDAILMETEGRYHDYLDRAGPAPSRRFEVVLTFRRAPAEDGAAGGQEEGAGGSGVPVPNPADLTVMTVQVGPRDTVDSLNRRIRNEVTRLRKLAQRAAGGGDEAAPEGEDGEAPAAAPVPLEAGPSINTVLPDNAALAPLRALLYSTLTQSLTPDLLVTTVAPGPGVTQPKGVVQREMAYDAALWNFPFPEQVTLEILV